MRTQRRSFWIVGVLAATVLAATAALPLLDSTGASAAHPTRHVTTRCSKTACSRVEYLPPRSPATGRPAAGSDAWPSGPFRVLQLSLCENPADSCYQGGKSVPEARSLITQVKPDLVTISEACSTDVDKLSKTMESVFPNDWGFGDSITVTDRSVGGTYECPGLRGSYVVGMVGHFPAGQDNTSDRSGEFTAQDPDASLNNAWSCTDVLGSYYGCTTDLANDPSVAAAQCKELMDTDVPAAQKQLDGYLPTVVGGDLNLTAGGSPDVQDCVPDGWIRDGDGAVQHVMATDDITSESVTTIPMQYTDHPALQVDLTFP